MCFVLTCYALELNFNFFTAIRFGFCQLGRCFLKFLVDKVVADGIQAAVGVGEDGGEVHKVVNALYCCAVRADGVHDKAEEMPEVER